MAQRVPTDCNVPLILAERSLGSAIHCFLPVQVQSGLLDDVQTKILDSLLTYLTTQSPQPDLIIYIRCEPEVSMARIKHRQREEEASMDMTYIKLLHKHHDDWLLPMANKADKSKVLVFNNTNTVTDTDFASFAIQIKQACGL